jgi:polyketide synthase PksN
MHIVGQLAADNIQEQRSATPARTSPGVIASPSLRVRAKPVIALAPASKASVIAAPVERPALTLSMPEAKVSAALTASLALASGTPASGPAALREQLRAILARVLFVEPEQISEHVSFETLGLDSVLAVEWIREVNRALGTTLAATDVYDYPSLRAMGDHMWRKWGKAADRSIVVEQQASNEMPDVDAILRQVEEGALDIEDATRLLTDLSPQEE